jgi:hypothetical protein
MTITTQTLRTLKLPFYRTIPEIRGDRPTLGSVMNYTPYDVFCVRSQLQALTPYSFDVESVEDFEEEKMKMVFTYNAGSTDKLTVDDVQSIVDEIISLRSDYYPIWSYKTPFTKYRIWEQNVIVPMIEQKFKAFSPVCVNGSLMLSLSGDEKLGNYIDIIESQTKELYDDIIIAMKEGWISCDKTFAKKWGYFNHISYDNIYVMEPSLSKALSLTEISPSEFLFSVYVYPNDCMIIPLRDTYNDDETFHDISMICKRYNIIPLFMGSRDIIILAEDFVKINVQFLISILTFIPTYDENREVDVDVIDASDFSSVKKYFKDKSTSVYRNVFKKDNVIFISTSN